MCFHTVRFPTFGKTKRYLLPAGSDQQGQDSVLPFQKNSDTSSPTLEGRNACLVYVWEANQEIRLGAGNGRHLLQLRYQRNSSHNKVIVKE